MKTPPTALEAQTAGGETSSVGVQTQSTQQQPTSPLPTSSVLMQVSGALGGVLILILIIAWLFRRLGFAPQANHSKLLSLKSSCQVGQRERVLVVQAGEKWLVLGVTAQQITLLDTLPAPPQNDIQEESTTPMDFRKMMKKVLQRSGKTA